MPVVVSHQHRPLKGGTDQHSLAGLASRGTRNLFKSNVAVRLAKEGGRIRAGDQHHTVFHSCVNCHLMQRLEGIQVPCVRVDSDTAIASALLRVVIQPGARVLKFASLLWPEPRAGRRPEKASSPSYSRPTELATSLPPRVSPAVTPDNVSGSAAVAQKLNSFRLPLEDTVAGSNFRTDALLRATVLPKGAYRPTQGLRRSVRRLASVELPDVRPLPRSTTPVARSRAGPRRVPRSAAV